MSRIFHDRVEEQAGYFRKAGQSWPYLKHVLVFPSCEEGGTDFSPDENISRFPDRPDWSAIATETIQQLGLPGDAIAFGRSSWRLGTRCVHIFHGGNEAGIAVLKCLSPQALAIVGDDYSKLPRVDGPWGYDPDDDLLAWVELVYLFAYCIHYPGLQIHCPGGFRTHEEWTADGRLIRQLNHGLFEASALAIASQAQYIENLNKPRNFQQAERDELCFNLDWGRETRSWSLWDIADHINKEYRDVFYVLKKLSIDSVWVAIERHAKRTGKKRRVRRAKRDSNP